VVGNALAVLVIAKWEHKFDRKKALAYEREVLGRFDKTADQYKSPVAPPGFCRLSEAARHFTLRSTHQTLHPVSNPSVQLRFNQYSAFCLLGVIKPFSPCLNNIPAQYSAPA
jgi:hypothetical protein